MAELELHYLGRRWRLTLPSSAYSSVGRNQPGGWEVHRRSLTALVTAMMRAAHTRLDPHPLIDDRWGDRLVPDAARAAFQASAAASHAGKDGGLTVSPESALDAAILAASGYPNVIVRTRYAEDALRQAIAHGTRQYVILGAGFDSFALRGPAYAQGVFVFEIDLPCTQALKRQCMARCGVPTPESVQFIAADFASDDFGAILAGSAYRSSQPAFFSWLGVTMFLTREANLSMFNAIARCSAPGSEIVFTYLDERIFQSGSAAFTELRDSVSTLGEPLRTGFDPVRLESDLMEIGLKIVHDVSDAELIARYAWRGISMTPMEHSRIAHARVI